MKQNLCNMVANIKNGQLAKKAYIYQKKTLLCQSILNILWDEGFILGYKIEQVNIKNLKVFLKYKKGKPSINSIKTVSKPSLRIYYSIKQLWKLDSSKGLLIISTNKGLKSLDDCKKHKLGGEPFFIIN